MRQAAVNSLLAVRVQRGADDEERHGAGRSRSVEPEDGRSNFVIKRDSDDHELAQQNCIEADGTGREWLAVQYEYTRRHGT
jgi:hypothetical protein